MGHASFSHAQLPEIQGPGPKVSLKLREVALQHHAGIDAAVRHPLLCLIVTRLQPVSACTPTAATDATSIPQLSHPLIGRHGWSGEPCHRPEASLLLPAVGRRQHHWRGGQLRFWQVHSLTRDCAKAESSLGRYSVNGMSRPKITCEACPANGMPGLVLQDPYPRPVEACLCE